MLAAVSFSVGRVRWGRWIAPGSGGGSGGGSGWLWLKGHASEALVLIKKRRK